MEQSSYSQSSSSGSEEVRDVLGSAASEFSKSIAEATGKLVGAADQFASMSTGMTNAVNEVRAASSKAQEAQRAAEEAKAAAEASKAAAEAVQAKIDRDYGSLKGLMSDLQERIAALAVLGRPMSIDSEPSAPADSNDNTGETPSESSSESASPATENAPSPAGWQGWQG